jgi:hypothetical protein
VATEVCFAGSGCGQEDTPTDSYPIKKEIWAAIAIPIIVILLMIFPFKYSISPKKIVERLQQVGYACRIGFMSFWA